MGKQKRQSSQQRQRSSEYSRARKNYMQRRLSWIYTHHMLAPVPPTLKELGRTPTLREIQKLQEYTLKNLSERQQKALQKEYTRAYDAGELEKLLTTPPKQFRPQTEKEWLKQEQQDAERISSMTQPTNSDAEIIADLMNYIDGVIEVPTTNVPSRYKSYADEIGETFKNIFYDAVNNAPSPRAFLRYLETPSVHRRIVETVTKGIMDSKGKHLSFTLAEFAQILNLDRPLSTEQSFTLESSNSIDFDYSESEIDTD